MKVRVKRERASRFLVIQPTGSAEDSVWFFARAAEAEQCAARLAEALPGKVVYIGRIVADAIATAKLTRVPEIVGEELPGQVTP